MLHEITANLPEPDLSICTGTSCAKTFCAGTIRNLTSGCAQEPSTPSAPEPFGTSPTLCTKTFRNLVSAFAPNLLYPPEPCPEPGVEAAPDRTAANLSSRPHSKVLLLGKNSEKISKPHAWATYDSQGMTFWSILQSDDPNFKSLQHHRPLEGCLLNVLHRHFNHVCILYIII